MRSYTEAMRTNRPARRAALRTSPAARPTACQALTTLLAGLLLLCGIYQYAASGLGPARHHVSTAAQQGSGAEAPATADRPLLDPSAGRGAASPTCEHASRSPRCRLEGGQGLSLPRKGDGRALQPATDDGQTALLQEDVTRPAPMPGRVPGRGGWVSELGPSRA